MCNCNAESIHSVGDVIQNWTKDKTKFGNNENVSSIRNEEDGKAMLTK